MTHGSGGRLAVAPWCVLRKGLTRVGQMGQARP
jgi:hypothetical protein